MEADLEKVIKYIEQNKENPYLAKIISFLEEAAYRTTRQQTLWLIRLNYELAGRSPYEMLLEGKQIKAVVNAAEAHADIGR